MGRLQSRLPQLSFAGVLIAYSFFGQVPLTPVPRVPPRALERSVAEERAQGIAGVVGVRNLLTYEEVAARPDSAIADCRAERAPRRGHCGHQRSESDSGALKRPK